MSRASALTSSRGPVIVGLIALPLALMGATALLWWKQLPQRLPTHWNGQGHVDGYTPLWQLLVGCLAIAAVAGAVALVFANDARNAAEVALPLLVAGVVSGTACSAWLTLAGAALTPGTVLTGSSGLLAVAGILYGAPLWLAAGRDIPRDGSAPAVGIELGESETACWVASVRSPAIAAIGLGVIVVAGGAVWLSSDGWTSSSTTIVALTVVVVMGAFIASLSTLIITVDARGLTIRSRMTRLLITRIRLSDISEARVEFVSPSQWGGWGYRILPGKRAVVLHPGTGLVVTKHNGGQFAVTVASAQRGAELIQGLLARTR